MKHSPPVIPSHSFFHRFCHRAVLRKGTEQKAICIPGGPCVCSVARADPQERPCGGKEGNEEVNISDAAKILKSCV